MKSYVALILVVLCGAANADESVKIRSVLEANFQACNNENIDELMNTQARSLPKADMDQFRAEAQKLFADTDVYLRLEDFQLIKVQGQYAAARVVQVTLPADEAVRQNPDAARQFYRNHTMLLPEHERVEYIQTFRREGGKWRLWEIVTRPKPVGETATRQEIRVVPNCRNGQCQKKPVLSPNGSINVFR